MKKRGMKRILSVLLSLVMVLGLMPVTVYADDTYPGYAAFSHIPLSACGTYPIQSDKLLEGGAEYVLTFATKSAGSIEKTGEGSDGTWQTYEAGAYNGWEFNRWVVWYNGDFVWGDDPTFDEKYYFSNVGSPSTKLNVYQPKLQINKDATARNDYFIYAVFRPVVSFEIDNGMGNLVVTDTYSGVDIVNGGTSGRNSVRYGNNTIKITAMFNTPYYYFEKKIYVNGEDKTSELMTEGSFKNPLFQNITAPINVRITTVVETKQVSFDANGGSGTMTAQIFNYDDSQQLTANSFTREGYYFTGWNTEQNPTIDKPGESYQDKQYVIFYKPEANKEGITLYAQWEVLKDITDYSAPTAKTGLVYDGSAQALVSAGTVENGGTMKYSLDKETWSTVIPTAINAGDYTVWYKIEGDLGYYDVEPQSISVSIDKATAEATDGETVTATGTYGNKLNELTVDGLQAMFYGNPVDGTWRLNGTEVLDAGTYEDYACTATFTANNFNDLTVEEVTADIEISQAEDFVDIDFPQASKITYGDALSKSKLIGGSTEYGSFAWEDNTIVPESVNDDEHTVVFTPNEKTLQNFDYDFTENPVTDTVTVTINKATPTGQPTYTPIRTEGKTLKDAALKANGGTFSVEGTVKWQDANTTAVEQGVAYTWVFTPADTTNYETLTGTLIPWNYTSSGGGGGSSTSVKADDDTVTVDTSSSVISASYADRAVEKAEENDADEIVIDTNKDIVTLPAGMAENIVDKTDADLVVETKNGTVTIPNSTLEDLDAEGKVTVEVTKDKVTISDEDGELSDIGKIEVTVPYKENSETGNVAVEVTKADGTKEVIEDVYDGKDSVTFEVDGSVIFEIIDDYVPLADVPVLPEQPVEKTFKDVSEKDWFYQAVMFVSENGLMSGVNEDNFGPSWNTTRGMITTIIWRMEGKPEADAVPFKDVKTDAYYADAIAWAAENGVVAGYSETAFAPDDNITREQLASILWRYAKYKGYDVSVGEDTNILSYTDAFDISDYAFPAMQWACGAGIISGNDDGTLNPGGHAQRAHAAQMLMKFLENVK